MKQKGQGEWNNNFRSKTYNSEKVGGIKSLIYILNRFEKLDIAAIKQEDCMNQEQSEKLNDCREKKSKRVVWR